MNPVSPTSFEQVHLHLCDLTKTFGGFVALRNVSLQVYRGEFVCILGPSGCGKTTLLRIIAGLEDQDTGRIIQDGVDVSHFAPSRRDFGIVFQSYALFPNLSVAKNIAYGLESTGRSRTDVAGRVKGLLALVGMQELADRYPAQLSGGQQQRVALARALALSPGLLLLDEPLSALDARVRTNLRGELARLQRRLGVTTIMVTHDQEEALALADRIVVMSEGEIVQVGTPMEIYQHPASPFVADFVGAMNFLPGTVVSANGKLSVRCCNTRLALEAPLTSVGDGSRVSLAIRPEEVQLVGDEALDSNVLVANLEEVEFVGPFYRLRLGLECQEAAGLGLVAYVQPNAGNLSDFAHGMPLPIRLPSDRVHVFASTAGVTAGDPA